MVRNNGKSNALIRPNGQYTHTYVYMATKFNAHYIRYNECVSCGTSETDRSLEESCLYASIILTPLIVVFQLFANNFDVAIGIEIVKRHGMQANHSNVLIPERADSMHATHAEMGSV